jgi:hypothetical protein
MHGQLANQGRHCLKVVQKRIASFITAFMIVGIISFASALTPQPVRAAEEAQATSGISEFRATPARLRGRVELSWKYAGKPFSGAFVVERSTNGGAWRAVSACVQPFSEGGESYGCADTGLASGTRYTYRACIASRGTTCTKSNATKAVALKAP